MLVSVCVHNLPLLFSVAGTVDGEIHGVRGEVVARFLAHGERETVHSDVVEEVELCFMAEDEVDAAIQSLGFGHGVATDDGEVLVARFAMYGGGKRVEVIEAQCPVWTEGVVELMGAVGLLLLACVEGVAGAASNEHVGWLACRMSFCCNICE